MFFDCVTFQTLTNVAQTRAYMEIVRTEKVDMIACVFQDGLELTAKPVRIAEMFYCLRLTNCIAPNLFLSYLIGFTLFKKNCSPVYWNISTKI